MPMVSSTMPSSTTRHVLRNNLRQSQHQHGGPARGDNHSNSSNSNSKNNINNNFNHNGGNNNSGVAHSTHRDRRTSFAKMHTSGNDPANTHGNHNYDDDEDDEKDPVPTKISDVDHSSSCLLADLSSSNSELAHFLLANTTKEEGEGDVLDGLFDNPMVKSVRNIATTFITGEEEVNEVRSMGTNKAWFYSLALEPMEVRRDRIIMLAEAYAIFGALFLGGTWVLYEWGSSFGYGGCFADDAGCHPAVDRAFEAVMALSIIANIFQAMFASFLWLMSILFSGSHQNWVYGTRYLLLFCHILLTCVLVFTASGIALGLYAKFTPHWPELGVTLAFFVVVLLYGMWATSNIAATEIPLEYYHFPNWFKWGLMPFPLLRRGARQKIREAAERRAMELKARAFQERTLLYNADASTSKTGRRKKSETTSVGRLLRCAADAIGRFDFDVSKYVEKLEEDWYIDTSELRDMSVDVLSKYMPRRLADEVHNQLVRGELEEMVGHRTSHIASGIDDGDERESRLSWNFGEYSDKV